MSNVTLYPELIDYIFDYCTNFMTEDEHKARVYQFGITSQGFQTFKEQVAKRIYSEHKEQLKLNLCPKCYKIARTPQAKQCRFCFYDWH
jgi:ribosomal protein L40E